VAREQRLGGELVERALAGQVLVDGRARSGGLVRAT